jgi:fibronectin type 3 domain-containing protein
VTLNPGQSANLTLKFSPASVGSATGQLTVTSNSSSNPTATISLNGSGAPHQVELSWSAPAGSSDPVVGFNVYRAPTGTSSYQIMNSGQVSQTVYTDSTVQSGQTYDYIVKSVDSANVESTPSNTTTVSVP